MLLLYSPSTLPPGNTVFELQCPKWLLFYGRLEAKCNYSLVRLKAFAGTAGKHRIKPEPIPGVVHTRRAAFKAEAEIARVMGWGRSSLWFEPNTGPLFGAGFPSLTLSMASAITRLVCPQPSNCP